MLSTGILQEGNRLPPADVEEAKLNLLKIRFASCSCSVSTFYMQFLLHLVFKVVPEVI